MTDQNAEQSYKTIFTLWAALFGSQMIFPLLVFFVRPDVFTFDAARSPEGGLLTIVLAVAALGCLVTSFAVRRMLLRKSVDEQKISYVQTAVVAGSALAEGVSLLGVMLAVMFGSPYSLIFLAAGLFGVLLQYPRRDDVLRAAAPRLARD